jgi:glycosyltransferase involved in cell wall biosynthesis
MKIIGQITPTSIAVVMPTFNHEKFIREAAESVISQEFSGDFHLYIHDDASTDATQNILLDLYANNPDKVTIFLQDTNQYSLGRPIAAEVYDLIQTKYLAWCEGDDFWNDKFKLQKQYLFMENNAWCSLLHHSVFIENSSLSKDYENNLQHLLGMPKHKKKRVTKNRLALGNFIMTCAAMVRWESVPYRKFKEIGDLMPMDYLIFILSTNKGDIGFIDESMATYRIHSSNMWAGQEKKNEEATMSPRRDRYIFSNISWRRGLAFKVIRLRSNLRTRLNV